MEVKNELLKKTGYVDENNLKELVQEPDDQLVKEGLS